MLAPWKKSYDQPAATAAKSLQSCPTLCDPIDGSSPGSPVPGIIQARTLECVAISFSNAWKWKVKVKLLSRARLLATPWTAAHQAPPSMGFSRQEYWSGVPLPPRQHIKKYRHYFPNKSPFNQSYDFSGSHVWTWEVDYKESWAPKNWCFWTVVLEKTLESHLDCKEIQPVHPKGNHSWIFIGRTDAEAETLILWPPDAKNWLIWKDSDAGKYWRQEKGTTEDEMADGITDSTDMSLSKLQEFNNTIMLKEIRKPEEHTGKPGVLQSMGSQRVRPDWVTELNWGCYKFGYIMSCKNIKSVNELDM